MYTQIRTSVPKIAMLLVLTVSTLLFSAFTAGNLKAQTVTTDQPDYAPRSTATFSGSGFFGAYEDVLLKVKNISHPCNTIAPDSSYLPWTVTTGC
jgi:hypothetical protein